MLMPILTARLPALSAQTIPAEALSGRDRVSALALSISAQQSASVLKLFEALSRHVAGSEVLPREGLVRLMETLSRILKLPPLPQETPEDFGRRLAAALEKLPPEARIALEKQLGQRNLAGQVRVLVDALRNPTTGSIAPSRGQQMLPSVFLGSAARGDPAAQARPAVSLPSLPAQHLATLTAGSAPVPFGGAQDAALLQSTLRKTFGGDERASDAEHTDHADAPDGATAGSNRTGGTTARVATPRTDSATAALPLAKPSAQPDPLPLLRAATAFLAADPEALSLVKAIAQSGFEQQTEEVIAPPVALGDEASHPNSNQAGEPERSNAAFTQPYRDETESAPAAVVAEPADGQPETDEAAPSWPDNLTDAQAQNATTPEQATPQSGSTDPELLEQTALPAPEQERAATTHQTAATPDNTGLEHPGGDETAPEDQTRTATPDADPMQEPDRQQEKPTRILAETLKALVQSSLPQPDSEFWPAAGTAGYQTADGAARLQPALSAPTEMPALEAMLDAAAADGPPDGAAGINDDAPLDTSLETGPDEPTDDAAAWQTLPRQDDAARDPLVQHRMADIIAGREAIPFAMVPYLPAQTDDDLFAGQTEEQNAAAGEEENEEQPDGGEERHPGERDAHPEPEATGETEAATDDTPDADAYALYMRMGGIG